MLSDFVSNISYGLASPFLPTVLDDKGISSVWTGIIFASYAVASTIASLVVGSFLEKIGHKASITIGSILMGVSVVAFGTISDIPDKVTVIALSILLRIGQGIATGMLNTASYSFVSTAYGDNVEKVLSIMETVIGLGCMSGPVLGSFVYSSLGFSWTFYIFGGLMAPISILIVLFLPKPADVKEAKDKEN